MKILLDTNFILTCIKEKLDFSDASRFGKVVIPEEVINELKGLSEKSRGLQKERAILALDIIRANKFKIIKLKKKFVDEGIREYVKKGGGVVVATLDRELKKSLKNKAKILVIRAKKRFEIV